MTTKHCFRFIFSLAFILFIITLPAAGQEKCGVPVYQEMQKKRNPLLPDKSEFEDWILRKTVLRSKKNEGLRSQLQLYQLPVVIHIIHKGEAVGTGTNIPQSQVLNQIETINTDFRRMNEAQINQLPAAFRSLAADTEIEFLLAKQDPEGLATSGITRTRALRNTYRMEDDLELKNLIQWDPENYINIYVVDLAADVIGYAQFPETDKLQGLELGQVSGKTDGVVIDYKYFGSGGNADASSLGRTLTHELGHFFGLRHTWGDTEDCEGDDYVTDTPLSSEDYDGQQNCSATPSSCGSLDMFQNYLTYASDACMSLFTAGQKERMAVVLENSPRRRTLNDSYAKEEPVVVENDAGISLFSINITDSCTHSFIPTVNVRNYGNNPISSFDIKILIEGVQVYSQSVTGLNLQYLQSRSFQLSQVDDVFAKGELSIDALIENVNGTTDNKPFNNTKRTSIFVPYIASLPFLQDFQTSFNPFYKINPDYFLTWQVTKAPISGDPDNLAAYLNFYDYEKNEGTEDLLISPVLNFQGASQAFLSFRYAYAQYNSADMDRLKIYVISDCSASTAKGVEIFNRAGSSLATASPTIEPFVPNGNEQWRTAQIDLAEYTGMENLQIVFSGINDYGNNLYIDDIEVFTDARKGNDVAIHSINSPSIASCETSPVPGIIYRNAGTETVNELNVVYSLNDNNWEIAEYETLDLDPLESILLELPPFLNLGSGTHHLQVRITSVNGTFDENPVNDYIYKAFAINTVLDSIPLRQQFSTLPAPGPDWININPDPALDGWVIRPIPGARGTNGNVAVSEFYAQPGGQENWLVSPTLDLQGLEVAGVQFRHAYAPLSSASDILQVRVSTDCGKTWSNILYEKGGSDLSSRKTDSEWAPTTEEDWDQSFVDLSQYAGLPEVRVAFVAISDGGNDIYLDNIEFFQSNVPFPFVLPDENSMYVAPNPSTSTNPPSLAFNLKEREEVLIQVYNVRGAIVFESLFPNILNQKIELDVNGWAPGMYFVKAKSTQLNESLRLIFLE